jgi:FkbM family methyltransferase
MKIEKLNNGLWVPSTDAQIEQWRKDGKPYMQDKCLHQFTKWCDSQNKKFKTIVDVGAWCGTWSMVMQKYSKEIKCFEPNKTHFECLHRNLAPFNHIKLYNQAVGNEIGFIKLSDEVSSQNTRVLMEKGGVPIATIDSLDLKHIDLLKIDVEGLEMEVLKGAKKTIENIQYIMIELNNNSKRYGSSNLQIEKHIKDLGFRILIKTWPDIVYYRA